MDRNDDINSTRAKNRTNIPKSMQKSFKKIDPKQAIYPYKTQTKKDNDRDTFVFFNALAVGLMLTGSARLFAE